MTIVKGALRTNKKKVIIIGAGISGLSAACYLKKQQPHASVTLLEASGRIGGKIRTERRSGFVIECGPEGYMTRKPGLTQLIQQLGLGDKLIGSKTGAYSIYVNHRLRRMPRGTVMGIPTKMLPMVTTNLISPLGKLRAALDLLIPRVYQDKDLSLDEFFRRRLGSEVVANMIEPLLSGIYNGELSDMSLEATLPQFAGIEKKYRSLILGMKHLQPPKQPGTAPKKVSSPLLSLSCGMDVLTEKLAAFADEIRLNTRVRHVKTGEVTLEDGSVLDADAVILATSPKQFGPLLDLPEAWSLSHDKRTSTATVSFAFKNSTTDAQNGSGYVVSRKEGLHITACSWMDRKWPHVAPEDCTLIRTYIGSASDSSIIEASDATIEKKVLTDLRKIGKLGTPLFSVITRQIDNMPQYTVNHNERIWAFEQVLDQIEGVYACGAMLHGVGIPDCVETARHVAEKAAKGLDKAKAG